MKIIELKKVPKNKVEKLYTNGVKLEALEENTANYLILYGFIIDVIRPTSTPRARNPDFLINGVIWEIKTPITSNEKTIKERFRKAGKQSDKVIFDLRNIKKHASDVEKYILQLFKDPGRIKRLMIIEKSGKILDIFK